MFRCHVCPSAFLDLRRALACALLVLCTVAVPHPARAQSPFTGLVVDADGTPVALARVRLLDGSGTERAAVLTDLQGRFTLAAGTPCADCELEASLVGFRPARTAAATEQSARLVLAVAPVRESVIVTATRGETPSGLVGSSVSVIARDDIERQPSPLVSDLLRQVPGITVVQTGGLGAVTSAFVRGGESDYTKILLDGVPLNEPGGTFNFSALTTVGLERIEVVRGPMSALFGSDAMSGVIQLVSTRADQNTGPHGSLRVQGGTYDTSRVEGSAGLAGERWDLSIAGGGFSTANRVPNNDWRHGMMTASGGVSFGRADRLSFRGVLRAEDQRTGVPGQTAFGRADLDSYFDRQDVVAGGTLSDRGNARWTQRATASWSRSVQASVNRLEDAPFVPRYQDRAAPFTFFDFTFDARNVLDRLSAGYQADWFAGRGAGLTQVLTAALDVDVERAHLEDRLSNSVLSADRTNVGLTLQHQAAGTRATTAASLRLERNESFGTAVMPRVSAQWTLRSDNGRLGTTRLKAGAGLGVKEPTIIESFSQNAFFKGNPDLKPERSVAVDIGIDQRLFEDRAKVDLTWFDGRYRDQIALRTTDFTTFSGQFFNVGRTRARGVELAFDAVPHRTLRLTTGYTFLASEIVTSTSPDDPVFRVGSWTFRRPRHSGYATAVWTAARVSWSLTGTFAGRRVDSDFSAFDPPLTEADIPNLWSTTARFRVLRRLDVELALENLTDANFMDPLGYEARRRAAYGGLRVAF